MMRIILSDCKSNVRWLKVLMISMFLLSNTIAHSTAYANYSMDYQSYLAAELSPKAQRDLKCLAHNVYYESSQESWEGKVAVAQVTVNRLNDGKFGNDICAVVHQRGRYQGKIVCQFSWTCTGVNTNYLYNDNWKASLQVAYLVYVEQFRLEDLESALFFHATHVNPRWALNKIKRIGNHIFYGYKK